MSPKKLKKTLNILDKNNYKARIEALSSESLQILVKDRSKALKYARIGIEKIEPEKLNEEYIEKVANDMQTVAQAILNQRRLS